MKLSFLVRVLFTCLLLFLVYSKIDFLGLIDKLTLVSPLSFLLYCTIYTIGQFISAYKWNILLSSAGINSDSKDILKAYFLAMFINSFGLGTVGGDVARGFMINCPEGKRSIVLASVLADRIHGLTVLLVIGLCSLIIVSPPFLPNALVNVCGAVALVFILSWFLGPYVLIQFLPEWFPKRNKIILALEAFPKEPKVLFHITTVSLVFHFVQIYLAYLIIGSSVKELNLETILITIPFVNIASALPISINGLGVREIVSVYLMAPSGISTEVAVAFSAIWVFVVTVVSGIGGLFVIPKLGEKIGSFLDRIKDRES